MIATTRLEFATALTWAFEDPITDPVLSIVNAVTEVPVASPPPLANDGAGGLSAVWTPPTAVGAGTYTATVTGTVGSEPATESATVYVSARRMYADVDEFKTQVLPGETTAAFDSRLLSILSAVSWRIEQHCGRTFEFGTDVESKRIDPLSNTIRHGSGTSALFAPDIATLDDLVIEYGGFGIWNEFDISRCEFEPGSELPGAPYTAIMRYGTAWDAYGPFIRVTAHWGWRDVPPPVVEACLIQATRIIHRKGSPEGVAGPAEWGLTRVPKLDPDVVALLDGLGRVAVA
jgi:hypothetical protein